MDNNMKYMKLYENFQERKIISAKDWKLFEEVNEKFDKNLWTKSYLFDNGDGTFDYDGNLIFAGIYYITSLQEVIPLPIRSVSGYFSCSDCIGLETLNGAPQSVGGSFSCSGCKRLTNLKYAPQSVGKTFDCSGCTELETLDGAPQSVGKDFNCYSCPRLTSLKGAPVFVSEEFYCHGCTGLTSLKGAPELVGIKFYCHGCTGLISDAIDYNYENTNWEGYLREGVRKYSNSKYFSFPIWYESLAFVGARDPKAYTQVCSDFPQQTTFTQEQVEEIYKSDLIDYESTLVDAVKAGLPVPQEIMDRTKKYDHSEYRDSKLDSEWKDVF